MARRLSPWWQGGLAVLEFVIFLVLLVGTAFLVHLVLSKLLHLIKWERSHWSIQGMGLAVGAIRGLWWSGLVLLIMLSLGVPYLNQSIQERSVMGPQLVKVAQTTIGWVVDQYPGSMRRGVLIPTMERQGEL